MSYVLRRQLMLQNETFRLAAKPRRRIEVKYDEGENWNFILIRYSTGVKKFAVF